MLNADEKKSMILLLFLIDRSSKFIKATYNESQENQDYDLCDYEGGILGGIALCHLCRIIKQQYIQDKDSLLDDILTSILDISHIERDIINMFGEAFLADIMVGKRLSEKIGSLQTDLRQGIFTKVVYGIMRNVIEENSDIFLRGMMLGILFVHTLNMLDLSESTKLVKFFDNVEKYLGMNKTLFSLMEGINIDEQHNSIQYGIDA